MFEALWCQLKSASTKSLYRKANKVLKHYLPSKKKLKRKPIIVSYCFRYKRMIHANTLKPNSTDISFVKTLFIVFGQSKTFTTIIKSEIRYTI